MLIFLSPSKTLDNSYLGKEITFSQPIFKQDSLKLVELMQKKTSQEIQDLMGVSKKIADLNYDRFQSFSSKFTQNNSKPSMFFFKGDVYENMKVHEYTQGELEFAQHHLRILSGLYGVLKPLDLMQPYRLEMGTKLKTNIGSNLYDFWGNKISEYINSDKESGVLVNLASEEYFKAVNKNNLKGFVLDVAFKVMRAGELKTIGLLAKRARGMMADYIIMNKLTKIEDLKSFNSKGYRFSEEHSTSKKFVFVSNDI